MKWLYCPDCGYEKRIDNGGHTNHCNCDGKSGFYRESNLRFLCMTESEYDIYKNAIDCIGIREFVKLYVKI